MSANFTFEADCFGRRENLRLGHFEEERPRRYFHRRRLRHGGVGSIAGCAGVLAAHRSIRVGKQEKTGPDDNFGGRHQLVGAVQGPFRDRRRRITRSEAFQRQVATLRGPQQGRGRHRS
jgi:hypothetical protein